MDLKRLYVMNLSYQVTKEEIEDLFGKYGKVESIEIPFRKRGKGVPLGIGFVTFEESEHAISAYAELDKNYFQGRKIHIKPAEKKPPPVEDKYYKIEGQDGKGEYPDQNDYGTHIDPRDPVVDGEQPPKQDKEQPPKQDKEQKEKEREISRPAKDSDYKAQKEKILKTNFDDETNWNYLFMNQDTVAASMAKQLQQSKGEFLNKDSGSSMAVKMAKSETIIINQTKEWLKENNIVDIDALQSMPRNATTKRSDTIIMIKNIPATAKEAELKEIFERYGDVKRFKVSPFNTLAIAQYENSTQAKAALKNLAYYKVNYLTPIYLEMAPIGFSLKKKKKRVAEESEEEEEKEAAAAQSEEDDTVVEDVKSK